MKVAVCEDTDWLLSEEAYSIYAPCMYHLTCEDYKTQMEGFLQASSVKVFVCEDRNRKTGMITATHFYIKMGYTYKNGISVPDEEGLIRLEKHR